VTPSGQVSVTHYSLATKVVARWTMYLNLTQNLTGTAVIWQ
jgi:hypothetical protein